MSQKLAGRRSVHYGIPALHSSEFLSCITKRCVYFPNVSLHLMQCRRSCHEHCIVITTIDYPHRRLRRCFHSGHLHRGMVDRHFAGFLQSNGAPRVSCPPDLTCRTGVSQTRARDIASLRDKVQTPGGAIEQHTFRVCIE